MYKRGEVCKVPDSGCTTLRIQLSNSDLTTCVSGFRSFDMQFISHKFGPLTHKKKCTTDVILKTYKEVYCVLFLSLLPETSEVTSLFIIILVVFCIHICCWMTYVKQPWTDGGVRLGVTQYLRLKKQHLRNFCRNGQRIPQSTGVTEENSVGIPLMVVSRPRNVLLGKGYVSVTGTSELRLVSWSNILDYTRMPLQLKTKSQL